MSQAKIQATSQAKTQAKFCSIELSSWMQPTTICGLRGRSTPHSRRRGRAASSASFEGTQGPAENETEL